MPAPAKPKKQLNVPWSEADDKRLDEISEAYEMGKLAMALELLRFGMNHAKRARREQNERAEKRLKDADDPS